MPTLTLQILDSFPALYHTSSQSIQRGREYFFQGRVSLIDYESDYALCRVRGNSGNYEVTFEFNDRGELLFFCTCPQGEAIGGCKHIVAASMSLSQYIRNSKYSKTWKTKLAALFNTKPRSSSGGVSKYATLLGLRRDTFGYGYDRFTLVPYIVKANSWQPLREAKELGVHEINDLLDRNRQWTGLVEQPYQGVNPLGCLNTSPEGVGFFNVILSTSRSYYLPTNTLSYLPLLSRASVPVFLMSGNSFKHRLRIANEATKPRVLFERDAEKLTLQIEFEIDGQKILAGKKEMRSISNDPPYLLFDTLLIPLADTQLLPVIQSLPLEIPIQDEETFRKDYFLPLAAQIPIESDFVEWRDVTAEVVPRLYLRDDKNALYADLRFGYGEYEVMPSTSPEPSIVVDLPGTWTMGRIQRQLDRETQFSSFLTDSKYRLKRAGRPHAYATYALRARAHPYDFLLHSIPQLTQVGFEIYGEETLKVGKINRQTPTLRVNITSGIDWFDLKAVVEYGDQQVALSLLRKAVKRGEHYIKLADGSIGQIPEELLEKYKQVWNLAEETEDGFRLNDFHLPLIDSLLEGDAAVEIPSDLPERRERLRAFERILPQPCPDGFTGELRPYQKHGFDWLHFLRDYKFGGILADDMGLGKTIQVLAYLQSLREQDKSESASLLVVPKSLLVNWQRESEKFTPALRFLEYMGNSRQKDTGVFSDYDIVLTTYGTMLRDIETLRGYKFHYVILDESQAIKNPIAKSAKAARLLNAEHRLVMTGTPVENNTFELWSQFAFLNPGLLGNMDYFRSAFANPIENGKDESAALLRKLAYPFILRRTKEQVAPELPPRTERVIYTDMEPAQRKIYNHTKERYRAELLGLIETSGMADARMKILEGLLRLRQIAIHPALVERTYHGEAPKFEVLLETLETLQAEGHKALVFSQFVQTLTLLKAELKTRGIPFVYLDGNTKDRHQQVDVFQNDTAIPFFLISLKAGGVGLNLTAADYVIHLDPWWNPAVEMQASDRAHRIGQDKPVFVYKIIARDTVEEKILQLQERKRALVQSIIATESSFFKSLTRDDVQLLFS